MFVEIPDAFLAKLLKEVRQQQIDVSGLEMDHIGYQAAGKEDYERLLIEFRKLGNEVHTTLVRGRRVTIFRLNERIRYKNCIIGVVELYEPVEGQSPTSGWEHAEFVIMESFDEFMRKYPGVAWDTSAINQPGFPMLKLRLREGMQVKFLPKPILEVVGGGELVR